MHKNDGGRPMETPASSVVFRPRLDRSKTSDPYYVLLLGGGGDAFVILFPFNYPFASHPPIVGRGAQEVKEDPVRRSDGEI